MAEIDPTELVTVRHPDTLEEREVPRGSLAYFKEFEVLKRDGSVNPSPATPSKKSDG